MRAIRHILVVVDPTTQMQHGVEKGAALARAFGATLELFICDYQTGLLASSRLPRDIVQTIMRDRRLQLDAKLCSLIEPLRRSGLQVLADCSFQEHLHAGVIRKVRLSGADLVVKDTHFHGAIQRALITNSDWHLIRECPVPLLLAKASAWHVPVRVAAALDPGHADDKPGSLDRDLLALTERVTLALSGQAMAVHCFDPLSLASAMPSVANGIGGAPLINLELIDSLRQYHEGEFKALLAGRPALEGRSEMIEGAPVTQLPAYAVREHVDILVTGAVSRSPLRRLFIGSTAERLLDRLPCDILVVKPDSVPQDQQPSLDQ